MIRLECSSCKTVLSIDDAFGGAVCRCQYCGTIQTVPKPGQTAPGAPVPTQKELFKRKARIESALSPYNDSLDKAADEMPSGGLGSSAILGLSRAKSRSDSSMFDSSPASPDYGSGQASFASASASTSRATTTDKPNRPLPRSMPSGAARPSSAASAAAAAAKGKSRTALIIGALVVAAIIGGLCFYALKGNATPQSAPDAEPAVTSPHKTTPRVQNATPANPVQPAPAAICGVTLQGQTVIYIVDRNGCTSDAFSKILKTCAKSIESLSSSRRFQIIVWNNALDLAFPSTDPTPASTPNADAAQKALADTNAGSSSIAAILQKALASNPEEVVILSAVDLDEQAARDIVAAIGQKPVKLHGIAIGSALNGDQLRTITKQFGGEFRQVDISRLD